MSKNIKIGDVLSNTSYLTVLEAPPTKRGEKQTIRVKDSRGLEYSIVGDTIIDSLKSASNFSSTEKVTKTELVDILENAKDTVFTINFLKDDGTERTLVGHLVGSENKMGRTQVIDLMEKGFAQRQVNNRAINWIIINDVKYVAKK